MLRSFYLFYFGHVLPLIGRVVSGHRTAYTYLPRSVANFPVEEELAGKNGERGLYARHLVKPVVRSGGDPRRREPCPGKK